MSKTKQWLAKNLLGIDVKALSSFTPPFFNTSGGGIPVTFISDSCAEYVKQGYSANDVVYSILTIASEKERMPSWAAYRVKDESSLKRYELEMQKAGTPRFSVKTALDLRTKALELYTRDSKLNKILKWPNENETFADIVANSGISKRATGNRYLKATLLDDGPNKGKPEELILLPAQHVTITDSGTFPARATMYELQLGSKHSFTPQEIMHDKLFNPDFDISANQLYGMAPLKAGLKLLTRNTSSKAASIKSFDNLGPETLIYANDPRLDPDTAIAQAKATKDSINQMSGKNRKRIAVSGYPMGAVQLGVSPHDLQLIESEKWDVVSMANLYNFPHLLLLPDHATMSNLDKAEKALITRCSLPYLISFREHFNRKLGTDWGYKNENIYVDFDLSVYSELQADMKEMTDYLKDAWWLTARQKIELQQMEIPESLRNEPMLDRYLVPSNLVDISNLNPDILDNELDNQDQ